MSDGITYILGQRRKNLGISQQRLAEMAGLSLPTVQRFFAGKASAASYDTVCKIAEVLGMSATFEENMAEEQLLVERAKVKAKQLAKLVQGTSSLEAQGLSDLELKTIEQSMMHELLKGSRSRLWSE